MIGKPAAYHRRQSLRLKGYDYSQAGAYFVTASTRNHHCLFGEIEDGVMRLNDAGIMIQNIWNEIPLHYRDVAIDEFVIMPNHMHGIVVTGRCASVQDHDNETVH